MRRIVAGLLLLVVCLGCLLAIARHGRTVPGDGTTARQNYERGVARGMNGQYDNAIADFNEALRLDPNLAEAYYGRGFAYDRKGNQSKSDEDFHRAASLGYDGSYSP